MKFSFVPLWLLAAAGLLLAGCNYDLPLTARPTRNIEPRLLGDWMTVNQQDNREEFLHVRELDDATYVVALDNDIYRAFHSDFADTAFLSVEDLNSRDRKFLFVTYQLSADGTLLSLRSVSTKVVPGKTSGRTALQKLIQDNLKNPALFGETLTYTRKKAGRH